MTNHAPVAVSELRSSGDPETVNELLHSMANVLQRVASAIRVLDRSDCDRAALVAQELRLAVSDGIGTLAALRDDRDTAEAGEPSKA